MGSVLLRIALPRMLHQRSCGEARASCLAIPRGQVTPTRWPLVAAPLGQASFGCHCPTVLGQMASVSALNHTARDAHAAAMLSASIDGLRIPVLALGESGLPDSCFLNRTTWRCAAFSFRLLLVCGVVCFHPALWGYYLLPSRSIYKGARLARLAVQARALRGHKL